MKNMNSWDMAAWVLVLVGALNWGLIGFFDWNLVEAILGTWPTVVRVVYAAVGLGFLWSLWKMYSCK